jgi:hypothetical protein
MKRYLTLLLVCVFTLAGCTALQRQTALDALAPCLVDLLATQDIERAKTCFVANAEHVARDVLVAELQAYLEAADPSLIKLLGSILFPKPAFSAETHERLQSTQQLKEQVSKELTSWIPERVTLENVLYGMLGMARAQGLEPYEPSPQTDPYAWLKTSAGLGFAIVTITAFVRKYLPQNVDGIWVSVVAICVGLVIYYVLPIIPSTLFNEIARVVLIALSGVGTVTMVDRYVKPKPVKEE